VALLVLIFELSRAIQFRNQKSFINVLPLSIAVQQRK